MEKQFLEDGTENKIWSSIQKIIGSNEDQTKKDFVFSKYKVPVLNIQKEQRENKILKEKKKKNLINKQQRSKRLPYYAREKIYERDLKIMASTEIVKFLNKYKRTFNEEDDLKHKLKSKKRIEKLKKKKRISEQFRVFD